MIKSSIDFNFNGIALSSFGNGVNCNISNGLFSEVLFDRKINSERIKGQDKSYFQSFTNNELSVDLAIYFEDLVADNTLLRRIMNWLLVDNYKTLYFDNDCPNHDITQTPRRVFFAMVTDKPKISHNGISGYIEFTFITNSCYGYSPEILTSLYDLSSNGTNGTNITIINDGDKELLPEISLLKVNDGNVTISNTSFTSQPIFSFNDGANSNNILQVLGTVYHKESIQIDNDYYRILVGEENIKYSQAGIPTLPSDLNLKYNNYLIPTNVNLIDVPINGVYATNILNFTDGGTVIDGETIAIGNDTYEFDSNNVSAGDTIKVDISQYVTQATGQLQLNSNLLPSDIVQVGNKKYNMNGGTNSTLIKSKNHGLRCNFDTMYEDGLTWWYSDLIVNTTRNTNDYTKINFAKFVTQDIVKPMTLPYLNDTSKYYFNRINFNNLSEVTVTGQSAGDNIDVFRVDLDIDPLPGYFIDYTNSTTSTVTLISQNSLVDTDSKRMATTHGARVGDILILKKGLADVGMLNITVGRHTASDSNDIHVWAKSDPNSPTNNDYYNAQQILDSDAHYGYTYFFHDILNDNSYQTDIQSSDIIVGGTGSIASIYQNGAFRIAGVNRNDTARLLQFYKPLINNTSDYYNIISEMRFITSITNNSITVNAPFTLIDPSVAINASNCVFYVSHKYKSISCETTDISNTNNEVLIGSTKEDTISNIVKAINGTGISGTTYGADVSQHPDVTSTIDISNSNYMNLVSNTYGSVNNKIVLNLVNSDSNNKFTNSTMTGGSDATSDKAIYSLALAISNNSNSSVNTVYNSNTLVSHLDVNDNKYKLYNISDTSFTTPITNLGSTQLNLKCKIAGSIGNNINTLSSCKIANFVNSNLINGSDPVTLDIINSLYSAINTRNYVNVTKDTDNNLLNLSSKAFDNNTISVSSNAYNLEFLYIPTFSNGSDTLLNNEDLYVNNEKQEIISSINNKYRNNIFNNNWLSLPVGTNVLNIKGNCKIQFKYRKVLSA